MTIGILPPDVAARIAAGEVIERPVSVIRELLDNAIDAGASRVSVEIEDGGLALIRIVDDGHGIRPEEVEVAFERHATSKLRSADDLQHIRTLGFRGEALPSIAAAADVEVVTRHCEEPVGVAASLVGGEVVRRTSRASPPGTAFVVRDLFTRLPARRAFLGTGAAEARRVATLVSHYALAYAGIAFELVSGGRRVLATAGDGSLRHAFAAVYGAGLAAQMLDVDYEEAGIAVGGLAGPPSVHRGNRAAVSVFVNGRWVQSRPLVFAAADAYQSQLPVGRHPIVCLSIAVDDDAVDVNVHPAKAEVRFRDERAVTRAVRRAVGSALEGAAPVVLEVHIPRAPVAGSSPLREPLAVRLQPPSLPPRAAATAPVAQGRFTLSTVDGPDGARPSTHREVLPLLRVVGQLAGTYVVAEGPDGMYLVDQHAAHERVVYDRLSGARREAAADRQPLMEPVLVELDIERASTLAAFDAELDSLGLATEPFGERACLVRSVPAGFGGSGLEVDFLRLLDDLGNDRRIAELSERAAATVACHSSVRAGSALALDEMRRLLEDLERTRTPRTCPHGRPTLVHVSTELLERQFGRR